MLNIYHYWGFPDSSVGKESACSAGDPSSIPGSGRSTGEGIGYPLQYSWASLCDSAGKESACSAGDLGSISGLRRSPGEGKGYPLQYSGLENSTDCIVQFSSVTQSCPTPCDPMNCMQHARPPCPSPTPGVHPNPCPSSW